MRSRKESKSAKNAERVKNGKIVRDKRLAEGLSAEALAALLGEPNFGNVYKWEDGHKPRDPEIYKNLQAWLNNGLTSNGEYYEKKYIALLERTNAILEEAIKKLTK